MVLWMVGVLMVVLSGVLLSAEWWWGGRDVGARHGAMRDPDVGYAVIRQQAQAQRFPGREG